MKVLLVLPNNLGDTIMAAPVLEGLKARYRDCRITFFVEEGFEGGIENNPFCDDVLSFPRRAVRDGLRGSEWRQSAAVLKDLAAELNAAAFDQVINLAQHPYVSHLVSLIRAPSILGQRFLPEGNHAVPDDWSQYLYAIPFARCQNALHATDVYRRIAGVREHNGCGIKLSEDERARAGECLSQLGVDLSAKRIVVFQPGAAIASKRWPEASFVVLGAMLRDRGWQILVSGAPAEEELAASLAARIGARCGSTAGRTTFRQAVANLSFAEACVTGDTALMHAAAGLGVQVFALFGATNPVETGPYGNGHWVFSAHCPDRPCFCRECRNMLCMKAILPDTVFGCMTEKNAGQNPRCDVYRTSLAPGGDYRLLPAHHASHGFWDPVGAALTRRLLEPDFATGALPGDDLDECTAECTAVIEKLREMERLLGAFIRNNDSSAVAAFERAKQTLPTTASVGGFLTALLNIRLNSVPLLDPAQGVRHSAKECARTVRQLEAAMGGMGREEEDVS